MRMNTRTCRLAVAAGSARAASATAAATIGGSGGGGGSSAGELPEACADTASPRGVRMYVRMYKCAIPTGV